MAGRYCLECKAFAKAVGEKEPICAADAYLGSQADALSVKRDLVKNYPEWVGNFIRFLARLRLNYYSCPNRQFRKNLYSSQSAINKTKQ